MRKSRKSRATTAASTSHSKVSKIEEQMAHLKWRKMCTETRMQNVLTSSKRMSQRDTVLRLGNNRAEQRAYRAQEIIRDELQKPLELSNDFLTEFERKLEDDKARDLSESRQQVRSIQRLETRAKERSDQHSRNKRLSEKKKALFAEPLKSIGNDDDDDDY